MYGTERDKQGFGVSDQKAAAMYLALQKLIKLPEAAADSAAERIIGLVDGLTIAFGGSEKK